MTLLFSHVSLCSTRDRTLGNKASEAHFTRYMSLAHKRQQLAKGNCHRCLGASNRPHLHQSMAAVPRAGRQDYDYLIKLLLIGDSGASQGGVPALQWAMRATLSRTC
jgi:hypothetical protein